MAGLNFQTQTIINSNVDPDSKVKEPLFKGVSNVFTVKRDFVFHKNKAGYGKVCRVVSKAGFKAKLCKATLNFTTMALQPGFYRLDVYLGIEGAQPFIYSNPWVLKGMPLWVEFEVKDSEAASDTVTRLAKTIKDTHAFLYDKDLINVNPSEANLELEGATEYQRFNKIEIVKFEDNEIDETKIVEIDGSKITLNERGVNSFGTYSQIVKDLRLPTAANWQPYHIRQVETPIIDAIYDQFIIDYEAPSTNDGLGAVGQKLTSVTSHVFWVKHDVADAFSKALETAFTDLYTPGSGVEAAAMHTAETHSAPVKESPLNK